MATYTDDFSGTLADWTEWQGSGVFSIVSGELEAEPTSTFDLSLLNYDTAMSSVNHEAQIELDSINVSTFGSMGIYICGDGGTDQTFVYFVGNYNSGYKLAIFEAGSNTDLDTWATAPSNGDVIKLTRDGNDITAYVNGTERCSHTLTGGQQTSLSGHTYAGVYFYSGQLIGLPQRNGYFDNWEVSDVAGGGGISIPVVMRFLRNLRGR